jgi:glycerophosphoryl diester phosphodiesterase
MKRILAGMLLILTIVIALLWFLTLHSRRAPHHAWFSQRQGEHKPLIMAHQGGEGERPSNTMAAFQNAVNSGADVLDTDMQITKDGVLVLIHDATVDRTTNGKGAVGDLTLSQLQPLDAGYSYSADGKTFPYRGRGITIPTLEQFFNAFPDRRLGIEISRNIRDRL